jgi:class 3 adenylate cyclase
MNKKAFEGRIRLNKWNMERRVSLRSGGRENTASRNLRDSFVFVNDEACDDRRRGSDALSSGTDAEVAKDMLRRQHRADDEHKEFTLHLSDARSFGMRCCEALLGLVAYLGAYDAISNFHSFGVSASESGSGGGLPPQLERVLATRYAAMLLPLLLLRIAMRVYEPRSLRYTQLTAALFASLPAAALAGMFLCIGSEILPCVEAASSTGREGVSSALPPPCGIVTPNASRSCAIGEHGGAEYCARAPLDYATTMLVLHSFLPYSFVFARQNVLIAGACISTLAGALGFAISIWVIHPEVTRAPIPPFDVLVMAVFVIFGHLIGLAHQAARHTDVWEKSALRLRQARLLRSVQEETEHCERLLNNILPPHLVSTLGPQFLIAHQQGGAGAAQVPAPPPATEGDGTRQSVALGRGVLVCESYENCSFLFAKISGLAQLVNDEARAPTEIMRALQAIFDRFDALADMYGVQKVRKTANEFYLVAAGLPNQEILPTAEDRACGIVAYGFAMVTIMHMLNLELKKHDVEFSVQVGIHSGSAIAGIIGHKTVQYDLCGDAVNTAARMCSASLPDHVHVSEATYELVRHRFGAVCRGEKDIKGKGRMKTYFLVNLPPVATEVTLGHQSMPSSPSLKSFAGREDAEEDSDNEGEWQRNVRTSLILSA